METRNSAPVLDAGPEAGSQSMGPDASMDAGSQALGPETKKRGPIRSYRDLEVFQNTYAAAIEVMTKIVPKLPTEEQYDLADQLRRSSKAIPRLIAEGYAKKHQLRGFQKYLDDAMAECNETVVCLSQVRDIYPHRVDPVLCEKLIKIYDISGRQLYNLMMAWRDFKGGAK